MEQRAIQDRLDQLTAERRRIKVQEHRQAVERLLKERRVRRNLELEQIMRDHEAQLEEEKARYSSSLIIPYHIIINIVPDTIF